MCITHISYSDSQYGGKKEFGGNSQQIEKATGWMIMIAGRVKKCSTSNCADKLWGIPSLLSNGEKLKFILEQATKAKRESIGITLLFP